MNVQQLWDEYAIRYSPRLIPSATTLDILGRYGETELRYGLQASFHKMANGGFDIVNGDDLSTAVSKYANRIAGSRADMSDCIAEIRSGTRDTLKTIARATTTCRQCGQSIKRGEYRWTFTIPFNDFKSHIHFDERQCSKVAAQGGAR
jgi:hypothetical protein